MVTNRKLSVFVICGVLFSLLFIISSTTLALADEPMEQFIKRLTTDTTKLAEENSFDLNDHNSPIRVSANAGNNGSSNGGDSVIGVWETIIEDEKSNFIPTYFHINELTITKYSAFIVHHGPKPCYVAMKFSGKKGNRYVFTGIYDERAEKESGVGSICMNNDNRRYDVYYNGGDTIKVIYNYSSDPKWTYEFTRK